MAKYHLSVTIAFQLDNSEPNPHEHASMLLLEIQRHLHAEVWHTSLIKVTPPMIPSQTLELLGLIRVHSTSVAIFLNNSALLTESYHPHSWPAFDKLLTTTLTLLRRSQPVHDHLIAFAPTITTPTAPIP